MSRQPVISTVPATFTPAVEPWRQTAEPELSVELAEQFGEWLEGALDQLEARFAHFTTPESAHKSLFQTRSTTLH